MEIQFSIPLTVNRTANTTKYVAAPTHILADRL